MSELTREVFGIRYRQCNEQALWEVLQRDRAEVRKEVTEEILRDHFAMSESVEYQFPSGGGWSDGTIGVQSSGRIYTNVNIRRPPKTRPMTNHQKALSWLANYAKVYTPKGYGDGKDKLIDILLHGGTIDQACESDGIPTEVTE